MPWVFLNPLEKQTFTRVDWKDYNDYISCLKKYRFLNIDSERGPLFFFFFAPEGSLQRDEKGKESPIIKMY